MSKQRIEHANLVMSSYISSIRTVRDWADLMGWERTDFSRRYRRIHGQTAKHALKQERFKHIARLMKENPQAKNYEIACDLGFRDEKALYDYVRYHSNRTPTDLRLEIITDPEVPSKKDKNHDPDKSPCTG
ncbi:MAG: ArsR family transcriptional regulator [Bacteroidetes bacterium HLUCCA01]|nr:MAG: ArsR family transcriptional regulator [Bacteroidetes bacterium HLUCCA01]